MDTIDEKVKELTKDNPLTKNLGKEKEKSDKRSVFFSIDRLTQAACDMYCDNMGWDEMIGHLSSALLKLKGKEKELQKAGKKEKDTAVPIY